MTPFCQLTAEQHIHGGFFGGYFHLNPLQMSAADVQLLKVKPVSLFPSNNGCLSWILLPCAFQHIFSIASNRESIRGSTTLTTSLKPCVWYQLRLFQCPFYLNLNPHWSISFTPYLLCTCPFGLYCLVKFQHSQHPVMSHQMDFNHVLCHTAMSGLFHAGHDT